METGDKTREGERKDKPRPNTDKTRQIAITDNHKTAIKQDRS